MVAFLLQLHRKEEKRALDRRSIRQFPPDKGPAQMQIFGSPFFIKEMVQPLKLFQLFAYFIRLFHPCIDDGTNDFLLPGDDGLDYGK